MNQVQKEVIDHAKSNSENMRVAIQVGLSFQELRNSLIRDFAEALKDRLQELGNLDINVDPWLKDPTGSYTGMSFNRPHWSKFSVCIEAQRNGSQNYIIGIYGKKSEVDLTIRDNISTALNDRLSNGRSSEHWIWYQNVDKKYLNLDNIDALMAVYTKTDIVNYYSENIEQLLKIIDDVHPLQS